MSSRPTPPGAGAPPAQNAAPAGRRSYALESFSQWLGSQERLQILDFGGLNQQNLDYITGLGHRLYAERLLDTYDSFFTAAERQAQQFSAHRVEEFLDATLEFPDQSVDGALLWDTLQFLPLSLSQAVLDRLHRVLAPDALLLALFHAESVGPEACQQSCRIMDARHVLIAPRGSRRPLVAFNARSIEKFFRRFQALKFFLTRDNLQEIVARR